MGSATAEALIPQFKLEKLLNQGLLFACAVFVDFF